MLHLEPKTLRMIDDVLREPKPTEAPTKRWKQRPKRNRAPTNLGNIRKYFNNTCQSKVNSSNEEKEGGGRGEVKKRKVDDCLEHLPDLRSIKSRRILTEEANHDVLDDSRTLSPVIWGEKSISGREPGQRRPNGAGFKDGGTNQGIWDNKKDDLRLDETRKSYK